MIRNNMLMYDKETGSLWCQLTGEAVAGPLCGRRLKRIPAAITTWNAWGAEYPWTYLLSKEESPLGSYGEDHMCDYYISGRAGLTGPAKKDRRLQEKQLVLGLDLDGEAVAYPHCRLQGKKVIHDTVGRTQVVIFYSSAPDLCSAFSLSGAYPLSFSEDEGMFTDRETGSRWSGLTGRAECGPLAGKCLTPLPYVNAYWFAWHDFYRGTRVYL